MPDWGRTQRGTQHRSCRSQERLPGGGGGLAQVSKAKQDGEGVAAGSSWGSRMAWQLQ